MTSRFAVRSADLGIFVALFSLGIAAGTVAQAAEKKVPLTFSGGHETDPQDHRRPVVLVAAALGVKTEEFRQAFSGVTPARDRRPTDEEARRNKQALMKVLEPLGVTNDRLDEVSNYYRYRPGQGRLWTNSPAQAYAVIEDGQIKRIVVTEPGAGYSSPPTATIDGFDDARLVVTLKFGKNLKENGAVDAVNVVSSKR